MLRRLPESILGQRERKVYSRKHSLCVLRHTRERGLIVLLFKINRLSNRGHAIKVRV